MFDGSNHIALVVVLAAVMISVLSTGLNAQDLKIGYIDSQRIFAEYRETVEAEQIYKKEVDQWKAEATTMEQEIARLQEELRAQSLMLSEEKQKEKKLELDKKLQDYQKFVADTFGEEGVAARRNRELTQPIVDKINRILERFSEEEGYSLVFDVANANIVYAKKEFDLTDRVLEELNKLGQ
ncbi:MAG: OmpH family outer membrane protein [Candidatus Latescibacterota bacterium]|nr:MAG: OmpH family outer membrane protein [Candidatus Latescibacterota bacterium]